VSIAEGVLGVGDLVSARDVVVSHLELWLSCFAHLCGECMSRG
jgi:hypothetical protein